MNTLNLIKAYFSLKRSGAPNLDRLESNLQPIGTRNKRSRSWILSVIAVFCAVIGFLLVREILPVVNEQFLLLLDRLPRSLQIFVVATASLALSAAIGIGIYRLFQKIARRRGIEVLLQGAREKRKLLVYAAGSGAIGFCDAVKKLSGGGHFKNLLIFAHPPNSAIKQGCIEVMGAITALAPVQFAMGSHKAAATARAAESKRYNEGYSAFLRSTGPSLIVAEWSIFHMGAGHTSESCHTEWERMRTSTKLGASTLGRFFVVVRDASDPFAPEEEEETKTSGDLPIKNDVSNVVVKVRNDKVIGSGVVIDPEGFILTNAHVVDTAGTVYVRSVDGVETPATVVDIDQERDVALLQCPYFKGSASIMRGDSCTLDVGDVVKAVGYPADAPDESLPKVKQGVISNLISNGISTFVQSTVAVSPGYSGGALVTTDGQFMGLITSVPGEPVEVPNWNVSGRSYALSSNDVLGILKTFASKKAIEIAAD